MLSIIEKIHMVKKGNELRNALEAMLNFSIDFMYKGSSIKTMYQPQLEQVWAIKMAKKAGDLNMAFQGTLNCG